VNFWRTAGLGSPRDVGYARTVLEGFFAKLSGRTRAWAGVYADAVRDKRGIEIGGPSDVFRDGAPLRLYEAVSSLDACNFAGNTIWRSNIAEGMTYQFAPDKPAGRQYVCEASDLGMIPDSTYDFVLASHVIEHVANPIKALAEWSRVTRDDGVMIVVVPHKDATFDHRRPVTTLEHLADDLEKGTGEDDTTHLDEWLRLVDLDRATEAKPFEKFRERSLRNLENRGMHHHVFDTAIAARMVDRAGLQIVSVNPTLPLNIFVLARKSRTKDNAKFLAPDARFLRKSPFSSDRAARGA
jgi:SAM-dependent methyltransferase